VRKVIYGEYKKLYEFNVQEDTLKDYIWNALKYIYIYIYIYIDTLNDERFEKVVLQNHEVLAQLKVTNGHATHNVLKMRQYNVIMVHHVHSMTLYYNHHLSHCLTCHLS
jgi:hypothetical protein